ncbi:hypothetical protein APA_1116 [Pseudanabaena sp. lw0831]|nr:hypothetical protein APA_1116 [Pseudanabaena sp. lw0831]
MRFLRKCYRNLILIEIVSRSHLLIEKLERAGIAVSGFEV